MSDVACLRLSVILATMLTCSAPLAAQVPAAPRVTDRALGADEDSRILMKGERLPPTNNNNLPIFSSPESSTKEIQPSAGLTLLQRMGQGLPDLPPEKPYTGKIDEAYSAYQRGLFLEAMSLALPKAQKGDAGSQTLVAELLDNGLGVRRNRSDAAFWYEQAARAGDANAQYKYALMLLEGSVVKQDRKGADEMMGKAARGGNREAAFNIAQLEVAARPGEEGLKRALPLYEKAAAKGLPDAQYALSQLYMTMDLPKAKRQEAREWLLRAALGGYDTAQYDMGMWLINGIGGPQDYEQGFRWMRCAAVRGNVAAQNKLAKLYINAIGTRPDPIEAAKWYVLSRKAGLADLELEDFFLGIDDSQQQEAIARADAFARR
jgi:uncharacterized protein